MQLRIAQRIDTHTKPKSHATYHHAVQIYNFRTHDLKHYSHRRTKRPTTWSKLRTQYFQMYKLPMSMINYVGPSIGGMWLGRSSAVVMYPPTIQSDRSNMSQYSLDRDATAVIPRPYTTYVPLLLSLTQAFRRWRLTIHTITSRAHAII
jgi:hypothetical protein